MNHPGPSPSIKPEELHFRLLRFDAHIKTEFELIGFRMTWLMTSQAFLFAAFTVCVTANNPSLPVVAKALQYLVPGVAILSALFVALAIFAAHRVIEKLKPARYELERTATAKGYERLGVEIGSSEHDSGNLPSKVLPTALVVVWLALTFLVFRA